jgi:hypothetical protein
MTRLVRLPTLSRTAARRLALPIAATVLGGDQR